MSGRLTNGEPFDCRRLLKSVVSSKNITMIQFSDPFKKYQVFCMTVYLYLLEGSNTPKIVKLFWLTSNDQATSWIRLNPYLCLFRALRWCKKTKTKFNALDGNKQHDWYYTSSRKSLAVVHIYRPQRNHFFFA